MLVFILMDGGLGVRPRHTWSVVVVVVTDRERPCGAPFIVGVGGQGQGVAIHTVLLLLLPCGGRRRLRQMCRRRGWHGWPLCLMVLYHPVVSHPRHGVVVGIDCRHSEGSLDVEDQARMMMMMMWLVVPSVTTDHHG